MFSLYDPDGSIRQIHPMTKTKSRSITKSTTRKPTISNSTSKLTPAVLSYVEKMCGKDEKKQKKQDVKKTEDKTPL